MPLKSGREPSWWYQPAGVAAWALAPVAVTYGQIAQRRMERAACYRSTLPVICVGNFTAGGSGKTPFAAMLAETLIARGERPAILTRGFGGTTVGPHWVDLATDRAADVGDEPLILARTAPVMVAQRRDHGARAIEREGRASVIVMDDGLQNPTLARDLKIAVVDGARGVGNGWVIPSGPLRAPLASQLRMIDAVAFNGAPSAALARDCLRPTITRLDTTLVPADDVSWLRGLPVVAFAGIGNPQRFFAMVRGLGAIDAACVAYPDHAPYDSAAVVHLLALAAHHQATLVTTQKDYVRLLGVPALAPLATATRVIKVRSQLTATSVPALNRLLDRLRS